VVEKELGELSEKVNNRRVSARIEEVLNGWWRLPGEKFRRCKTLDVGLGGALVVLDTALDEGTLLEIHLDMDANWSVALDAQILWQRPIFFGKQQLSAVDYRFQESKDESMFGLWMQRKLKSDVKRGLEEHLAPVVLSLPKEKPEPVLEPPPKVQLVESPWKRVLSQLTAKIPWIESEPLPNERRRESRGQVGLTVTVETENEKILAEFLNVSLSGCCLYIQTDHTQTGLFSSGFKLMEGQRAELMVSPNTLLLGASRCKAEVVWYEQAEGPNQTKGLVAGLRFPNSKNTFVADLLKRINYSSRQARSELRFPCSVPLTLEFSGGQKMMGSTVDISTGGARIVLRDKLTVPCNAIVRLELNPAIALSARLLRPAVDKEGRNCYAVAFRKGQSKEGLELSRWLSNKLRMQDLDELIPNFSGPGSGESE
jgi:PilZ domain-containing protein